MLDLHHWYARLHGPRAVRVIQTALTDEARERAAAAPPAEPEMEDGAEAAYGTCTVPPLDEHPSGNPPAHDAMMSVR